MRKGLESMMYIGVTFNILFFTVLILLIVRYVF